MHNDNDYWNTANREREEKLRHRSFFERNRWMIIIISSLVVLVVVFASATFLLLTNRPKEANVTIAPTPTTQSAPTNQVSTVATPTPEPTPVASPTSSSTPTSSGATITKKLHLTCIITNGSCGTRTVELDVTLNTIIIDTANSRMKWSFTIKNTGTDADLDMRAYTLYLEDINGKQYNAGQPGTFTEPNPINAEQTLQEYTSFLFLPTPSITYTLHLTTYLGGPIELYQTETFTF